MGQSGQHLLRAEVAHGLDGDVFCFGGRAYLRHARKVEGVVRDINQFQGRRLPYGLGQRRTGVVAKSVILGEDESPERRLPQALGELLDTDVVEAALR